MQRIIVFCGPKGSGKDEAAKRLFVRNANILDFIRMERTGDVEPLEYSHINFAHPLKSGLQMMFGFTEAELNDAKLKEQKLDRPPYIIPRDAMKAVAKLGIELAGDSVWADLWRERVLACPSPTVVCTDLRRPAELSELQEFVKGYDVHLVYVHRREVELARIKGVESDDPAWTDDSESHYELLHDVADHHIDNNGSLNDLYTQVDNLFPKLKA